METKITVFQGKYRLTKRCGKGAFGQIFFGESTNSNEEVAVKLVSKFKNQHFLIFVQFLGAIKSTGKATRTRVRNIPKNERHSWSTQRAALWHRG